MAREKKETAGHFGGWLACPKQTVMITTAGRPRSILHRIWPQLVFPKVPCSRKPCSLQLNKGKNWGKAVNSVTQSQGKWTRKKGGDKIHEARPSCIYHLLNVLLQKLSWQPWNRVPSGVPCLCRGVRARAPWPQLPGKPHSPLLSRVSLLLNLSKDPR